MPSRQNGITKKKYVQTLVKRRIFCIRRNPDARSTALAKKICPDPLSDWSRIVRINRSCQPRPPRRRPGQAQSTSPRSKSVYFTARPIDAILYLSKIIPNFKLSGFSIWLILILETFCPDRDQAFFATGMTVHNHPLV